MNQKYIKLLILMSILLTMSSCAEWRPWKKTFWQDKNDATPLDKKFYDTSLIFKFCNEKSKPVTTAIGYWKEFSDKGNFFITEGWWTVNEGECRTLFTSGGLVKTDFYLHIQMKGKNITTSDFQTGSNITAGIMKCVESSMFLLFTQESKVDKECKTGDKQVPFLEIKDANKRSEYVFTYK